jgi:predicted acyl esterase
MLIEPRLDRRGMQLAGWQPKPAPYKPAAGIVFDADIPLPLPDGTVLIADLFRPYGIERSPVLIAWAAYDKDTDRLGGGPFIDESGVHPYVIKSGYTVLRIQPRGTGRSQGSAPLELFSPAEVQDLIDAIEWTAHQPWCDGSIGMTGMSYFAMIQLRVAGFKPKHLKAIFPYKGTTDLFRMGWSRGGTPYTGAMEGFVCFEGSDPPRIPTTLRHLASRFLNTDRFARKMSAPDVSEKMIRGLLGKIKPRKLAIDRYVRRSFDGVFEDGTFWADHSSWPRLQNIDIPVCIGIDPGAVGFHYFAAFEAWHNIRSPKFLFIGPPAYTFPWADYQEELVAWYDWQLKGIDNGYADLPRVRYWLQGAERWKSASDWPVPGTRAETLYLSAGEAGPLGVQRLLASAPPAVGSQSFLAIPSASFVVPELDTYHAQLLRYQSEPYALDTETVGPVTLTLWLSANAIDAYVVARLSDIAPDGRRTKLAWGWLLASRRAIDHARSTPSEVVHDHSSQAAQPLVPGEPAQLVISLMPIANLFRTGHRMEVEIASRPKLLASAAGEGFDMFNWDAVPYRARNTIHHGGETVSRLDVFVRPAA